MTDPALVRYLKILESAALPVSVVTTKPSGTRMVQLVYGYETVPDEKKGICRSSALPVYLVSEAELAEMDADFEILGMPWGIPIYQASSGMPVEPGVAVPVYVLNQDWVAAYYRRVMNTLGTDLIAYWPLWEPVGTSGAGSVKDMSGAGLNATPSAATFGTTGIGDGRTAPTFDGANSYINFYSSGLNSVFNGREGTLSLWAKVTNEAVWSDANFKRLLEIYVDANNWLIVLLDSTQPGFVEVEYRAGGVTKVVEWNMLGGLEYFNLTATWSKSADALKLYIDGVLQATIGGLGNWTGNLAATGCVIGNQNTTPGASVWSGSLAHVALGKRAITAAEAAAIGILSTWVQASPTWGATPDWQDEFDSGSVPNSLYWTPVNNTALSTEAYFLARNVTVAGGKMIITTQAENKGGKTKTSGYVHTLGKVLFTYGRLEISAKLPKSQGYWPAIWLLPAQSYFHEVWSPLGGYYGSWPLSGEIDVIEMLGSLPARSYPGMHAGNPHLSSPVPYYDLPSGDFSDGQHIFALEVLPHAIKWYIDGVLVRTHTNWFTSAANFPAPYDQAFYLILETALGGTWPGATDGTTVYPQTFEIDYVRYYKYLAAPQLLTPAQTYRDKVMALNPIAYWPLWEPSGTGYIYDQTATGAITVEQNMSQGETGIGDGRTAIKGNGSTSSVLIYSTDLNAVFNGQRGSLVFWAKAPNAGAWTGATFERLFQIRADDNNRLLVLRYGGANNQLIIEYHANGTTKSVFPDLGGTLAWFQIVVTWDRIANEMKVYVNGTQSGATQTGLGTWAGALDNWSCCIGSSDYTPSDVAAFYFAHVQLYDYALSQAQINTIWSI